MHAHAMTQSSAQRSLQNPVTAMRIASLMMIAIMTAMNPSVRADIVQVGPGADLAGGISSDTAGGERLNVALTSVFELAAGTYDILDFQLNVANAGGGTGGAGTVTPMLLTGSPSSYTTLWVGNAFDPTVNGVQVAETYVPGTQTFTLASAATIYGGIFTGNTGSNVPAFVNGVGNTDHDSSYTAPTGSGDIVTGFSNTNLPRSYAFEINIEAEATDFAPVVTTSNGNLSASGSDLLQTVFGSVINSGVGTPEPSPDGPQGAESILREGIATNTSGYTTSSTSTARISDGDVLTYVLDTSNDPLGFRLDRIDLYHGWRDSGRDDINSFDVAYSTVDDPGTFIDLILGGSSGDYASDFGRTSVEPGGPLPYMATNVAAVRITFNSIQNTYGGISEIDIIGQSIPTPAALPGGLGLIGLLMMRRRVK